MFTLSSARYPLLAACMTVALEAAAQVAPVDPNAAMRYVAAGVQADGNSNRDATGAASLTIGENAWVRGGVGSIRLEQGRSTLNATQWNLGGGAAGRKLTATLDFSSRADGARYEQRDWNGTVEWHNALWAAGIDGLHRDTKLQASVIAASGPDSASVPVAQALHGTGAGLHLRFNPSERVTLSGGGMRYNYSTQTRQTGTATTTSGNGGLPGTLAGDALHNQPLLAQQLLVQPSGVTRETALLQSSWNAGVGYRFDRAALSAQYFNDKALESDAMVNTIKLGAALFLSRHWTLAPAIGWSGGDDSDATGFGQVSTSYNW